MSDLFKGFEDLLKLAKTLEENFVTAAWANTPNSKQVGAIYILET